MFIGFRYVVPPALLIPRLLRHSTYSNAHDLFDKMPLQDFRACNAQIQHFTANCQWLKALSMFKRMRTIRFWTDSFALAAVIKCSGMAALDDRLAKSTHGFVIKVGCVTWLPVQKALMDTYSRFGALNDSCQVFEEMVERDSVSWNVMLTGFARAKLYEDVVSLFRLMLAERVEATSVTVAVILPVCAKFPSLRLGRSIHAHVLKIGLEPNTLAGNALVSMYAKRGTIMDEATRAFDLIDDKDIVSWNIMINGYLEKQFLDEAFMLLRQMVSSGLLPNYATIATVLPFSTCLVSGKHYGKELHSYVLRFGLEKDLSVGNALLTYYAKIGDMDRAEIIFEKMHSCDNITWNSMIAGYAMNSRPSHVSRFFHDLLSSGQKPDYVTLVTVLPVYADLCDVKKGMEIHGYTFRHSVLFEETSLCNALVSFYGKCGVLDKALKIFKGIMKKDLVSWNAILSASSDNEQWENFSDLWKQMICEGICPDSVTILSLLQASTFFGLRKVREAHGYSFIAGFMSQLPVVNAILDAYAKCGSTEDAVRLFRSLSGRNIITDNIMISGHLRYGSQGDAEMIFRQMDERDLTTWNLMVQVYVRDNYFDQAFGLFRQLQNEGMRPDSLSIMSILPACAQLASISLVRQCHSYKIRACISDIQTEAAFVDSYSKCGSTDDAFKLFSTCVQKDLVTFTAMVGGYAFNGMAIEAITVFFQMLELGIKPDHVLLTSILSACSHAGLVNEGWKFFECMKDYGIKLTMENYACVVDLLARKGKLKEAYEFVQNMPIKASADVWGALLGGCKIHKDAAFGSIVADHFSSLETEKIGNYVGISNIYADVERWDSVEQVRNLIKVKDMKKPAGCSWTEF